jgi:hypothetical protein
LKTIWNQSLGEEASFDELVTDRRLHPAVGGKYPERREKRSERDHERGEEMCPLRHELAAEQQHSEERRFEEEGHDGLISKERREHVRSDVREPAPISSELERHHDSGHHAHPERDGKDLDPEH